MPQIGGNSKMEYQEAAEKVIGIALAEVGYHEKASNSQLDSKTANSGSGNYTKYARDIDAIGNFYNGKKQGYAWCDQFFDWCHIQAWGASMAMKVLCQPTKSDGAGCVYSANYYKAANRWFTTPQAGDQAFFFVSGSINHTGMVVDVSGNKVSIVEGNYSDSVVRNTYTIGDSKIAGYGRPKFELLSDTSAVSSTAAQTTQTTKTVIEKGDTGDTVKELQEKLEKLGYSVGGVDGEFGLLTYAAVVRFQRANALDVDGIVGTQTMTAIDNAIANLGASTSAASDFAVGDTVDFVGNMHYIGALSDKGSACKGGKAKVTGIYKTSNAKHPYHLIAISGSGSTVYGWVNASDIEKV
jgi:peptidoglycan hydrolase-like protein with peptidoglycan-binding domain